MARTSWEAPFPIMRVLFFSDSSVYSLILTYLPFFFPLSSFQCPMKLGGPVWLLWHVHIHATRMEGRLGRDLAPWCTGPWLLAWDGMGHSEWKQCGVRKSKHLYVGLPGLGVGVGRGRGLDQISVSVSLCWLFWTPSFLDPHPTRCRGW